MTMNDVRIALCAVAGGCLLLGAFALAFSQYKTAFYFIGAGSAAVLGAIVL